MADDDLPPVLSGLPPPPPSNDQLEPDPNTLKDYNNYDQYDDDNEPNEYQQEVLEQLNDDNDDNAPQIPTVYEEHDEVKSHSNTPPVLIDHEIVYDNNVNNINEETENDYILSIQCMKTGQIPFDNFYEDLKFVHLSRYKYGIPTGLEGLKRRLIEENGLNYEGIFRLRGKEINLNTAKDLLNENKQISILDATPIEVAQLIKAFYRHLPCDEPGFIPQRLLNTSTDTEIISEFSILSEPRKSLLLWTFDLWIKIEEYKPKK
eukprot:830626_1